MLPPPLFFAFLFFHPHDHIILLFILFVNVNQTPGYMAPEVQLGQWSRHTDAFSLGIVLLELLTGLPAIVGAGARRMFLREYLLEELGGGGGGSPADPPQAALLELVDTRSGWPAVAAKGLLALAMRLAAAAPEARPVLPEALALLADLAAGGAGDPDSPSVRWPGKALPCQICLDAPRAAVFLPCRHAVACDACAAALTGQPRARCPICRTPVASVERAAGVVDRTWT